MIQAKAEFIVKKQTGNVIEEAELVAISVDSETIEKIRDSGDCYYQSSKVKVNSMEVKTYLQNPIIIGDFNQNRAIGKAISVKKNNGKLSVEVEFEPVFFNKLLEEKRKAERLEELKFYLNQFCPICGQNPIIKKELFDGFNKDTGEKEFVYQVSCPNHSSLKSFFGRTHYNRFLLVCAKKSISPYGSNRTVLERFSLL